MSDKVLALMKERDVEYVDLRFTDPVGTMQHLTLDPSMVDDSLFSDGTMFDGSSIGGWKAINESDMVLMPDADTARIDPFCQQTTLTLFCDVLEPGVMSRYGRDPRGSARAAEKHLIASGIGDTAFFGPEAEFFIFDDVRWTTHPHMTGYTFDSTELPANSGTSYDGGNMGHRPAAKGGYFPAPPVDSGQDIRSEMLQVLSELGIQPEKHHHEVAPAQHELGMKFASLVEMADRMQLYKHVVRNVAASYGKTATFMPKPYLDDNGSGMHVHQSIWKNGKPLFAGDRYADLSQECMFYIGGIIKHARAINAFANPTTNSYKRLVPGFEAPVLLAYSARNRSASVRIPYSVSASGKRIETRFPDAAGNPYLTFTALLMAGLDGIENRINPGDPMDKDLYALPPEELKSVPTVATSLRHALEELDADRAFLTRSGVMNDDQIDAYIDLKMEEVERIQTHPHPAEFDMYYKC